MLALQNVQPVKLEARIWSETRQRYFNLVHSPFTEVEIFNDTLVGKTNNNSLFLWDIPQKSLKGKLPRQVEMGSASIEQIVGKIGQSLWLKYSSRTLLEQKIQPAAIHAIIDLHAYQAKLFLYDRSIIQLTPSNQLSSLCNGEWVEKLTLPGRVEQVVQDRNFLVCLSKEEDLLTLSKIDLDEFSSSNPLFLQNLHPFSDEPSIVVTKMASYNPFLFLGLSDGRVWIDLGEGNTHTLHLHYSSIVHLCFEDDLLVISSELEPDEHNHKQHRVVFFDLKNHQEIARITIKNLQDIKFKDGKLVIVHDSIHLWDFSQNLNTVRKGLLELER